MANVVIASNDAACQSAKNWFVKNQGCIEGPPIDKLQDGDTLYIIAHDTEMGDASGFLNNLMKYDFPMTKFKVFLIVCSAASHQFGKDLLSPAERIANYFQRNVEASKSLVYGTWSDSLGASFIGNYITISPNTDVTSLFSKLTI